MIPLKVWDNLSDTRKEKILKLLYPTCSLSLINSMIKDIDKDTLKTIRSMCHIDNSGILTVTVKFIV